MYLPSPRKLLSFRSRLFRATLVLFAINACDFSASTALAQERSQPTEGWTDSSGEKTLKAEFVKLDGVHLTLRKSDGTEVVIPLSKLDDKSRLKARAMSKSGAATASAKSSAPVVFPANPTAQEFVDIIVREIKNENPIVAWDALPTSKQNQIQEVVKLAATRVEQRTLNVVKKFRGDLFTALKGKKQFILGSSAIPIPSDQKEVLKNSYDAIVGLLEAYIPNEWLDASYLQQADVRDLLFGYVNNVIRNAKEVEKTLPSNSPIKSMLSQSSIEAKVESISSTEAMITFVVPGQPESPTKFVLSEGRWLPATLLDNWDQSMGQARGILGQLDSKVIHQSVAQAMIFPIGLLGSISSAETQQDFDDAIGQLAGLAQMMSGLGGGAAPPPGAGGRRRP